MVAEIQKTETFYAIFFTLSSIHEICDVLHLKQQIIQDCLLVFRNDLL